MMYSVFSVRGVRGAPGMLAEALWSRKVLAYYLIFTFVIFIVFIVPASIESFVASSTAPLRSITVQLALINTQAAIGVFINYLIINEFAGGMSTEEAAHFFNRTPTLMYDLAHLSEIVIMLLIEQREVGLLLSFLTFVSSYFITYTLQMLIMVKYNAIYSNIDGGAGHLKLQTIPNCINIPVFFMASFYCYMYVKLAFKTHEVLYLQFAATFLMILMDSIYLQVWVRNRLGYWKSLSQHDINSMEYLKSAMNYKTLWVAIRLGTRWAILTQTYKSLRASMCFLFECYDMLLVYMAGPVVLLRDHMLRVYPVKKADLVCVNADVCRACHQHGLQVNIKDGHFEGKDAVKLSCGHKFHFNCLWYLVNDRRMMECHVCGASFFVAVGNVVH